ncbi:hypothetical protein P154DRAFT_571088 [Amniculicola lignicola CBS 123094]|uniref:Uncharacterized protein n=1 Tax=Amniculicola lignicola CBS 123094 TaxID=1392246 RepID=A0A6A5X2F0_9PLEO|nr:hypothetical protein P154DRAFT_571088 [Amniculicola lignicola CBS 123094]
MAEPALRDALLQRMEDSLPAEIRLIIYSHLYELEYKPTRLGKNIHQIRTKTLWRTYWRTYRLPSFLTKYLHMDALLSHVNTEMEAHARNLPIVILCTEPANACMEDVMGLVEMARGYDLEETTHSRDTARAVIKPMAINAPLRWLEGYDVEGAEEMAGEKLPRILQAMKPFLEQTVYQLRRNQVIHIRWLVKMHHGGIADVWRECVNSLFSSSPSMSAYSPHERILRLKTATSGAFTFGA